MTPPPDGNTSPKSKPPSACIKEFLQHSKFISILLFLFILASCFAVIIVPDDIYLYRAGQKVQKEVKAEIPFYWHDSVATEQKKKEAEEKLPLFFEIEEKQDKVLLSLLQDFLDAVRKKNSISASGENGNTTLPNFRLPPELQDLLQDLQGESLKNTAVMHIKKELLEKELAQGIISIDIKNHFRWDSLASVKGRNNRHHQVPGRELATPEEALRNVFSESLPATLTDNSNRQILANMLAAPFAKVWKGNLKKDANTTLLAKKTIRSSVEQQKKYVNKGETIFAEKQLATVSDIEKYRTYIKILHKKDLLPATVIANLVRMVMLLFVITLCIWSTRRELLASNTTISLLVLIAATSVLLDKYAVTLFIRLADSFTEITPAMIYFSLPIGFGVLLASAFFGTRTALFTGFFVSVVASMHLPEPYKVMFAGCFITAVTAAIIRGADNYRKFFIRAFAGCFLAAFAIAAAYLMHNEGGLWSMVKTSFATGNKEGFQVLSGLILLPVCAGLVTAITGQLVIFLLEFFFDVCTPMYLQLYSDLNFPLMRRLQIEAPGTYHHSLMVSTIAEQAARAIGADHIKARVCALYHDIGKLNQAAYFIENSNGVDMHAELSPSMSAIVILNHVKRGLELAAKYKLKKPLRETIAQHHGNSVVLFFYRLAEVEAKRNGTTVNQSGFCYDGPRPTSKENCIIMLSDCCEAASRSLQNPSKETVEHLVSSIISGKIKDGQLGDSTLSMQELGLIRNSITQTLVSMSHNRISYPKDNKEEKNEDDLFVAAGKGNISPSGTEKI